MSQASKQVTWCLNKAKKEMAEAKRLGKRVKHRGLVEIKPNVTLAKAHIAKAEHNLKAFQFFKQSEFSDWSMTTAFYSMYHCFLAICYKFGYESKNQTCTITLIEFLKEEGKIEIDERFIDLLKHQNLEDKSVIDLREKYTYGIEVAAQTDELADVEQDCKELLDTTKEIVF